MSRIGSESLWSVSDRGGTLWCLWGQKFHPLLAKSLMDPRGGMSLGRAGQQHAQTSVPGWLLRALLCPQSWFSRHGPQVPASFSTRKLAALGLPYFSGIEESPVVMSLGIILICFLHNTMNCFLCVTLGGRTKFSGWVIGCFPLVFGITKAPDSSELCGHSLGPPREFAWKQAV